MAAPNGLFKKISMDRLWELLTYALMGWYLFLCVVNYFYQRHLWNDELCVFLSVQAFSSHDMFHKELLSTQVFPRGYLYLIQQFSVKFDFSLLSLRFLPFVCMLTAFLVWLKVVSLEMKEKPAFFLYVLSWTASAPLLYYSGELKQYSMDVLVSGLFVLFLYHQEGLLRARPKLFWVFLTLLFLTGGLSYIAFLFMPIVLYNLFLSAFRAKAWGPGNMMAVGLFIGVAAASYLFDIRWRPTAVIDGYWDYFVHFDSIGNFFKTFGEGVVNLFTRFLVERPKWVKKAVTFFVVFGLIRMVYAFFTRIKKERFYLSSLQVIPLVLFAELFVLGALKKYPFTVPRTSLFFAPIVLYLTIEGIAALRKAHRSFKAVLIAYGIFLLILIVELTKSVLLGELTSQPVIF